MREFLRFRIWDCLLCTAIATGLVFHLFSGFYLSDHFSKSVPYVILFMAVSMFALTLFSYSKKTVILGIITGVALSQIMLVYLRGHDVFGSEASEETNSLFISLTVAVLTSILVYLSCRGTYGLMAMYLAGNILICGSYFLKFPIKLWSFLLFTFASLLMFWFRNYMYQLYRSKAGKIRLPRYMMQSILIGLLCICLGGAAYYGIVYPINPPTRELRLIQVLKRNQIIQQAGVYTVNESLNPDTVSSREPNANDWGNDNADKNKGSDTSGIGQENNFDMESQKEPQQIQENAINIFYLLRTYIRPPWIILMIVLILVFLWVFRKLGEYRYRSRILSLSAEGQVINLYKIIFTRLERAGLRKPSNHTLYEYAADLESQLEVYSVGEATFRKLTEIYVRTLYGHGIVTEEERMMFYNFYEKYNKTLRSETGTIRYLLKGLWL